MSERVTINGLLINPYDQTIRNVQFYRDSLEEVYKLLSHEKISVDCLDMVTIDSKTRASIMIDDEGLLKETGQRYFLMGQGLLAGKGLVVGIDDVGQTIDSPLTIVDMVGRVHWLKEGFVPDVPAPKIMSMNTQEEFDSAIDTIKNQKNVYELNLYDRNDKPTDKGDSTSPSGATI